MSVTVAYVHPNEVAHSWHRSMVDMIGYDVTLPEPVLTGGWMAMRYGTDGLPGARNKAVAEFLDAKSADWLLWTDTDMGFGPNAVHRLLEVADPVERPIVGALCFSQREHAPDGLGGFFTTPAPTIYDWVTRDNGEPGFLGRATYPVNTVVRCAGTGSAFILIHRSVFERIEADQGPVWYDRVFVQQDGRKRALGEDLSFCLRAGALDIPIHVHTGVRTSHLKQHWVAEADFWDFAVPPPATDEVAVIVPVTRRPHNADPFMRSLRASTGLAHVYAVCDVDDQDTAKAWDQAGATVLYDQERPGRPGSFAEKLNVGYANTQEPWLFVVGDDVRFHSGWLDHAQAIAADRYHVIGTNDLANPRTVAGEHSPHLLIRRSYVDEQGASWDGPGTMAHEGYRHWFVDDEIVTCAKQRDVWAMALGSKVEHLHPIFGTAPDDGVYRLGRSHAKRDREVFEQRRAEQEAATR
ncbi:MAG TPA: glycosyltransferase [Micromonosporaceae bacterium]